MSARSMIEASAPMIIAADKPRTLACAVKNCLKRSRSESNSGLARVTSNDIAMMSPRISCACSCR